MPETANLPAWGEMTDLDKGAALLHLHKREWEGDDYAIENYPARYFNHPALVALSPQAACRHAVSVENDADLAGALGPPEYDRLYDLALDADDKRWRAERNRGLWGVRYPQTGTTVAYEDEALARKLAKAENGALLRRAREGAPWEEVRAGA